ncbi:hypothetical protein TrRE_jg11434 [Triparma retinervis]|uniref:Uncharacterized protein n=1 Tax=Triparma retinervis TaxID=2557542 RepID=A0A9W7G3U0_9STRA|nr:hypothetical protein TrRE_jg11434 [Triparma retinervis]
MKSFAAIISFLILGSGSAFHAPAVATSRVSSLRSEPNDDSSSSTGTQDSPDAQREALERQFKQNSKDVGVKNADGSFGTPKGGYSIALPFLAKPKNLDGSFPGDAGFDPLGLGGSDKASLSFMREAEIKHGRLAMLACVGWPMAELLDKGLASTFNLPPMLTKTGASPSLLNGGLDKINPFYWALVFSVAALAEYDNTQMKEKNGKNHVIGDCGYDVLGLMPTEQAGRFQRQTSEIKHGRVAMMAIVGYAVQEALYRTPVTGQFPFNMF